MNLRQRFEVHATEISRTWTVAEERRARRSASDGFEWSFQNNTSPSTADILASSSKAPDDSVDGPLVRTGRNP